MSDSEEEREPTLEEDIVVTKYKMASDIVSSTLTFLISQCVPGANVNQLCEIGDARILEETTKVFKKEKEMKKGVAFPTCICVNHIICNFSPLKSETNVITLKDEDLVKINMGVHIDGFPVMGGVTFVVGASAEKKVTGRKADVILAAHYAAEACLRLIKVDNESHKVADVVNKVATEYKCKIVEGTRAHSMKRNEYEDKKFIIWNPTEEDKKVVEKCTFEKFDVWNVSVAVTTGEGRPKPYDTRTTVLKRNSDIVYQLKMKSSRQFFHDISHRFASFPFTLRAIEDEKIAKVGAMECRKHNLLEAFPVYNEREGEFVAIFQFTILVMPKGPMRIGALPFDSSLYQSDLKISNQELKDLLNNTSVGAKKKKKKKAVGSAAKTPESAATTGGDA